MNELYRILVKVLPVFNTQSKEVVWHIPHQYQVEMSKKSTVVSK